MQDERPEGVSAATVVLAFLGGAAVGAIAALLLAPQSGEQSRERLRAYARRTGESVRDFADKAGESWQQAVEKGRDLMHEQKSMLKEAFDAGREAIRRQREQDEQRMG